MFDSELQYLGSEGLGESTVRYSDVSLQELDHGLGEGQLIRPLLHLRPGQVVLHHELSQISNDLGGRSHLEKEISVGVKQPVLGKIPDRT